MDDNNLSISTTRCQVLMFAFSALTWLGVRKSISPVKIWLMRCWQSSRCHIVSCFIKIQIGLAFLVPTYTGCPGKQADKRVLVYLRYRCTDANSIAIDYFRCYELRESLSDTALLAMTSALDCFTSCRTAVSCSLSATTKLLVYTGLA